LKTPQSEPAHSLYALINPFSGSFRVEGLKLSDAAGAWSVAWQEAELVILRGVSARGRPVVVAADSRLHASLKGYARRG